MRLKIKKDLLKVKKINDIIKLHYYKIVEHKAVYEPTILLTFILIIN